jgi:hypothetical protein
MPNVVFPKGCTLGWLLTFRKSMKKIFVLFFCLVTHIVCHAQTAEELNAQSKEMLCKNDFTNAVPLLKRAADAGNPEAEYNYGVCYQQGIEVGQDDKTANEWFLKSASQGWVDAEYKIAYSYETGRGIDKDDKQAFYWSLKCAQQNDPECMFNVVGCYMEGSGTAANSDSMLAWAIRLGSMPDMEDLEQSANITGARKNLALMYRDGDKIPKDPRKSYMWFLLYNESKHDFSTAEQQANIDAIKDIEKNFTAADKEEIKKLAELQTGRPLKNLDRLYIVDTN